MESVSILWRKQGTVTTDRLSSKERTALRHAKKYGWLTLIAGTRDAALTCWQRECDRCGWPFVVLRLEPRRTSLWFVLPSGYKWEQQQQAHIRSVLAGAYGVVLTDCSVRAFLMPGTDRAIIAQLLGRGHPIVCGNRVQLLDNWKAPSLRRASVRKPLAGLLLIAGCFAIGAKLFRDRHRYKR